LREVAIGKRVQTATARVSIPTEKERAVIESITPEKVGAPVTPDTAFKQEKVMRMEVYEETAISKNKLSCAKKNN
jgi:stress response protein YsnF